MAFSLSQVLKDITLHTAPVSHNAARDNLLSSLTGIYISPLDSVLAIQAAIMHNIIPFVARLCIGDVGRENGWTPLLLPTSGSLSDVKLVSLPRVGREGIL